MRAYVCFLIWEAFANPAVIPATAGIQQPLNPSTHVRAGSKPAPTPFFNGLHRELPANGHEFGLTYRTNAPKFPVGAGVGAT